jgi:hypothetical protein
MVGIIADCEASEPRNRRREDGRPRADRSVGGGLPLNCARPGPTRVQPGKVRTPIGIAGHDLPVEHRRFGWELVQQLSDRRETLREVVPIAAVDGDTRILFTKRRPTRVPSGAKCCQNVGASSGFC